MSQHRSALTMGAAALALVLGLSGCSSSVESSDVEEQISQQLEKQIGQAPDDVKCPNDLDAKEGAEERCTLTVEGQEFGVSVKVTKVDGNDVNFDISVDDEPEG